MNDNWRDGLIGLESGKIDPRRATNVSLFLSEHPEMKGVFGYGTDAVIRLKAKPPWETAGNWTERPIQHDDYYRTLLWLERQDLTPSRTMVRDAIAAVAQNNC